jgi:predicted nucleic acid-binding protein
VTDAAGSRLTYLDTSAIVKLILREAETVALRRFLRPRPQRASSALSRVEVLRAIARTSSDPSDLARGRDLLESFDLVLMSDEVLAVAAALEPATLRSLDAIHLASALSIAAGLESLVTYDERLGEAARLAGLPVQTPR